MFAAFGMNMRKKHNAILKVHILRLKIVITTIKSSFAPNTSISVEQFVGLGTGRDAFNFLRSNNGILELSFISS